MIPPLYVNQPSLCATSTFILHSPSTLTSRPSPAPHPQPSSTLHIYWALVTSLTIYPSLMHFQGGAMYIRSSTVAVSSSSFTSNTAVSSLIVCCYINGTLIRHSKAPYQPSITATAWRASSLTLHIDHSTPTLTNSHLTTVHTPHPLPYHTTSHGNMHHDDDDDGWPGVACRGLPCSIDHTTDECHMRARSPTVTLRPALVLGARHVHCNGHGHQYVSGHQSQ